MEQFSFISYVDLLLVACGFLILQYLQIVLIAKYGFSDSERKVSLGSFGRRRYSNINSLGRHNVTVTPRRSSISHSPSSETHAKRRGRRTFGIKHL